MPKTTALDLLNNLGILLPEKKLMHISMSDTATEYRRGCNNAIAEYNKALSVPVVGDETRILKAIRDAFKLFKDNKGKSNSYEYTVAQYISDHIGELMKRGV